MRKVLVVTALLLFAGIAFGQNNFEKEKEAIKAVIEEETDSYYAVDYERWSSTNAHKENFVRLTAGSDGYGFVEGWDEFGQAVKEGMANYDGDPLVIDERKSNYRITVYEDCAWAIFDNDTYDDSGELTNHDIGVNILEKVDGEWKIVFLQRIGVTSYETEAEETQE